MVNPFNLNEIRVDGGTQSRVQIDKKVVSEYAQAVKLRAVFPPVVIFFDGKDHWLADGFHRFHAHKKAGAETIAAEIRKGEQRDAILHSLGANCDHGLRRSNADKRKAVQTVLADSEWGQWADRKIAAVCGVSHEFVRQLRTAICQPLTDAPTVRSVQRAGKTYQQDTSRIGKSAAAASVRPKAGLNETKAEQPRQELPETEMPTSEESTAEESPMKGARMEEVVTQVLVTEVPAAEVLASEVFPAGMFAFATEVPPTDLSPTQSCSTEMPAANEPELSDGDRLAEAQNTICELTEKLEQLEDRLAVEAMDYSEEEKTKAAHRIEELKDKVRHLERDNAALKASRDDYMLAAGKAKREALHWRNEAQKARAAA